MITVIYGDDASGNDDYSRTNIRIMMVVMVIMQGQTLKR